MKNKVFRLDSVEERMLNFNAQQSGAASDSEYLRGMIGRDFTRRVSAYCDDPSLTPGHVEAVLAVAMARQAGPDAAEWLRWLDRLGLLLERVPDTKKHKHDLVMHLGNSPLDLEAGWAGEGDE